MPSPSRSATSAPVCCVDVPGTGSSPRADDRCCHRTRSGPAGSAANSFAAANTMRPAMRMAWTSRGFAGATPGRPARRAARPLTMRRAQGRWPAAGGPHASSHRTHTASRLKSRLAARRRRTSPRFTFVRGLRPRLHVPRLTIARARGRHRPRRQVRDPRPARRRRDGRRVSRAPQAAWRRCGGEGDQAVRPGSRRMARALPARGACLRAAPAPAHRLGARLQRRRPGAAVPGDGVP